jgi:phosphatidylinositol-3-phosphatase
MSSIETREMLTMRRILWLAAVAAAALAGALAGGSPAATSGPCVGTGTHPWKVLWIVMENKNYSDVIGSSSAPYENALAAKCGLATNYHAITHPSLPNYIAMTSGSTHGVSDDGSPSSHPLSGASVFSQGRPAKSYEESMPSSCYLSDSGLYRVHHNPEAYYTSVRTACKSGGDVPMGTVSSGSFHNALIAGKLPRFSLVTPNMCHDTHDCSVATGDSYLKSLVPAILAAPDYQAGRLALFLTWDENDGLSGNRVPTIVVSPHVPAGTRSGTRFTHYSLLRTAEELLGVPLLRNAQTAASMRAAFRL